MSAAGLPKRRHACTSIRRRIARRRQDHIASHEQRPVGRERAGLLAAGDRMPGYETRNAVAKRGACGRDDVLLRAARVGHDRLASNGGRDDREQCRILRKRCCDQHDVRRCQLQCPIFVERVGEVDDAAVKRVIEIATSAAHADDPRHRAGRTERQRA